MITGDWSGMEIAEDLAAQVWVRLAEQRELPNYKGAWYRAVERTTLYVWGSYWQASGAEMRDERRHASLERTAETSARRHGCDEGAVDADPAQYIRQLRTHADPAHACEDREHWSAILVAWAELSTEERTALDHYAEAVLGGRVGRRTKSVKAAQTHFREALERVGVHVPETTSGAQTYRQRDRRAYMLGYNARRRAEEVATRTEQGLPVDMRGRYVRTRSAA